MQKLIFDRTSNDITRAKKLIEKAKKIETLIESELDEYYNGLKGCYNISDLNRVEEAVQYISDLLNSLNYKNEVNTKKWEPGYLFTIDLELSRYLQNIQNIRNAIAIPNNIPQVPNSYKPYSNANTIEKIIYELYNVISYLEQNFIYCGVSDLGQSRLWQQRFRTGRTWASQNYMLSQYADADTINTISSQDDLNVYQVTNNLALTDINEFDNPRDTINSINNSMQILDDLIGGEI